MKERIILLAALAEAVAGGQPHRFEGLVKAAYEAGADREDLLTAVEIGRVIGEVSGPVLTEACATVQAWQWMVVHRLTHRADVEAKTRRRERWALSIPR
ncbi:MAG: hypothetical protein A3H39_07270 [candidate division NC10 bacterium RIFCSPLOWO2_02_FULL_66_22]|nr:MAG: hypothetical protein A3H39_07270 [candidate division NC10 bacterium RIFCSPLOWO2_02_FULL_66_22]